jgi:hypothetical protein
VSDGVEAYISILPKETRRRPRAQEVSEAHGLCNRHSWQSAAQGPERRNRRLWQLALAGAANRWTVCQPSTPPPSRRPLGAAAAFPAGESGRAAGRGAASPGAVPRLPRQAEIERHWVKTMAAGLNRDDLAQAFARSSGLCLPHLLSVLRLGIEGAARARLERPQADSWQALLGELDEFIHKHDYRFSAEPMGNERDSPWRAIARWRAEDGCVRACRLKPADRSPPPEPIGTRKESGCFSGSSRTLS